MTKRMELVNEEAETETFRKDTSELNKGFK